MAAAARAATSGGGSGGCRGGLPLADEAEATGDHAAHRFSRLGMPGERGIVHALPELKSFNRFAGLSRNRFVEISCHDVSISEINWRSRA